MNYIAHAQKKDNLLFKLNKSFHTVIHTTTALEIILTFTENFKDYWN